MRHSKSIRLASVTLVLAGMGIAPASMAATATGSMLVTASVFSTCAVVATPIVFGSYTQAQLDASALITVTCTPDIGIYNVGLNKGQGASATTTTRHLSSLAADALNYSLYRDSGRTQNWGEVLNTDTLSSALATTTLLAVKTFTVYGRIPAAQPVNGSIAGLLYSDTIQVSVNY